MFASADIVVQAVMVGLAFASVVTWTVWLAKSIELVIARRRVRAALSAIAEERWLAAAAERLAARRSVVAAFLAAAQQELRLSSDVTERAGIKDRVASRLARLEAAAARDMNRGTGVLATIGSTAPFVGLFGTVWGIMNSFIGISKAQTTNLAVVAPGIAEALLATAIGLFAAIPAVIVYNQFARSIGGYRGLAGRRLGGGAAARLARPRPGRRGGGARAAAGGGIAAEQAMAGGLDSGGDELSEHHDINVTPFIDVMLVLLIIFMVAAPLSTVDVAVDLPVSSVKPQPRPERPVFLTIKADRTLALGNDPVAPGRLAEAIEAATKADRQQRVFLRADKTVPYGELMQVMNLLRRAGYLKVALVGLERPDGPDEAPPTRGEPPRTEPAPAAPK